MHFMDKPFTITNELFKCLTILLHRLKFMMKRITKNILKEREVFFQNIMVSTLLLMTNLQFLKEFGITPEP